MKLFKLSFATLLFRYYLMMAVVIFAGFTGLWFLAILALPIFFSALMGIQFKGKLANAPSIVGSLGTTKSEPRPVHD